MKPQVVIVGAGGHAKVIIDILEQCSEFRIAGCTSPESGIKELLGYPVLGTDDCLKELFSSGVRSAIVAIGDNGRRLEKLSGLRDTGFELVNAISPHAIVSPRAMLGRGVCIMPGAIVNVAAVLEDGVIANTGATIDHDCAIGECAHIAPGVNLAGGVRVGAGSLIGIGSRVIPNVTIGAWTSVGAGAVVVGDLDSNVTAVGIPARIINRGAGRGR